MRQRPLGNTGLKVSELCLGTWGLCGDACGPVQEAEQDAVIERAQAAGITLFDTADSYARGRMETRLGERLENDKKARIVTKLGTDRSASPPQKKFKKEFLKDCFEASAERLKRDTVDVVLLHNPSNKAFEKGEATELLSELKEAGRVRAWGASVSRAAEARAAMEAGAQVLAMPYNAFFSAELSDVAEEAEDKGVGLLAHSVLAYGLLTGTWSRFKTFQHNDHRRTRWNPDQLRKRVEQAAAMRVLMGDGVPSVRAAALRYVLNNERVSSAIIGPRSSMQFDQLIRDAAGGPPYLPEDRLERLKERLVELKVGVNKE